MIEQAVAVEHIRSQLEALTGRPVYLVRIPDRIEMPYAILYLLPMPVKGDAPLVGDPGPWRCEIQATAVGRNAVDASWMIGKVDHHLSTMDPPAGHHMSVIGTVSPVIGESVGVCTMVARWQVQV